MGKTTYFWINTHISIPNMCHAQGSVTQFNCGAGNAEKAKLSLVVWFVAIVETSVSKIFWHPSGMRLKQVAYPNFAGFGMDNKLVRHFGGTEKLFNRFNRPTS